MPTLGRPMRAILREQRGETPRAGANDLGLSESESSDERRTPAPAVGAFVPLFTKIALIAAFKSLIPCPVVAEMRKVWSGLMPRCRNSEASSASPRSDLLSRSKTGFFDLRADLAICLSLSSVYLELSRVRQITSAASIASAIWSWMLASKSSSGSLRPAVSMRIKRLSMRAMTLSRVVPSSRATIAMFLRAKRFNRLDLPALV